MENLLAAVDLSTQTQDVIALAARLSSRLSAKLWIVHVAEPDPEFVGYGVGPQSVRDSMAKKFHKEHCHLQDICENIRLTGIECTAVLVQGDTVDSILLEAERLAIDMLLIGAHNKSVLQHFLVGSVSEGVLRQSKVPVIVVPAHKDARAKNKQHKF